MSMPGGGTFVTIKPGQYTDDNEMAYHLLQGLCSFDEKSELEGQKLHILKNIGLEYVRWVESYPFDIGNTCGAAIYILRQHQDYLERKSNEEDQLNEIFDQIYEENKTR